MLFRFFTPLLISASIWSTPASAALRATPRELQNCNLDECERGTRPVKIDFSDLRAGQYVKNQYKRRYGVTFSADTSSVRGGFDRLGPRLFDSSRPTGRDFDLGSPNEACPGGGPGRGAGGVPARFGGENCVPLGNVLIIQERRKGAPDDNAHGGKITIDFDSPTEILSVGFLDIEEPLTTTTVQPDITLTNRGVRVEGDNSFVDHRSCELRDVLQFTVDFPSGGAITDVTICV